MTYKGRGQATLKRRRDVARVINLHGGPYHGQTMALEDGYDHFHVSCPDLAHAEEGDMVPIREGMYSKVAGRPNDFEWDGWRSHD